MMVKLSRLVAILVLCTSAALAGAQDTKVMEPVDDKPAAPGFVLPDIAGQSHKLADYSGEYILVNFWATWCAPCRKEMPAMNQLDQHFKETGEGDNLQVIGIHVGPGVEGIKQFLKDVPVDFTILVDKQIKLTDWNVVGLPTTFLVGPDGHVIARAVGERSWNSPAMQSFLQGIIDKTAGKVSAVQ